MWDGGERWAEGGRHHIVSNVRIGPKQASRARAWRAQGTVTMLPPPPCPPFSREQLAAGHGDRRRVSLWLRTALLRPRVPARRPPWLCCCFCRRETHLSPRSPGSGLGTGDGVSVQKGQAQPSPSPGSHCQRHFPEHRKISRPRAFSTSTRRLQVLIKGKGENEIPGPH